MKLRNFYLVPLAAAFIGALFMPGFAHAHGPDVQYSAGQPGDPKQPARTVKVTMFEQGKKMLFEPQVINVKRNEQIRFVLVNDDHNNHEFILATPEENRKHAEEMKKNPHMEHAEPNAATLSPYETREIVWKFTKRGEFQYVCLIPGHYEAGMVGKVIVE
jgi:uncharacterized cupredoxin-like copper-binding protein